MTIEINTASDLKVSPRLIKRLIKLYDDNKTSPSHTFVVMNFRDKDYDAESGGFQPVEIAITRESGGEQWDIVYISSFRYFGYPLAELDIELDFNFDLRSFLMVGRKPIPLNLNQVRDVYRLWERNFLSYVGFGAFDEIKLTSW